MSQLQRMPFVEKVIADLSDAEKTALSGLINGSSATPAFRSLINPTHAITEADEGVSFVALETKDKTYTGYLAYTDDYCVLFTFERGTQDMGMADIDLDTQTYRMVCEPLTIFEFRTVLGLGDIDVDLSDYATKTELQGVESGIGVKYIGAFEGTDTIEDLYDEAGISTPFAFNYGNHAAVGSFRWAVTDTAMILEVEYLDGSERFLASGVVWNTLKEVTLSAFLDTSSSYYRPYTLESQLGVKNIGNIPGTRVLSFLNSAVSSEKPFAMLYADSGHPFIGSYHISGSDYLLELEDLTTKDRFVFDSATATDTWGALTFANFLDTSGSYYKPYALASDLPQGEVSIDFNGTATATTEALQRVVVGSKTYTVTSGMTNPMFVQGDIIVGGSGGTPTRLGIGSAGKLLASTGTGLAYTGSLPILTTAPSTANADGLKIVVLSSEPATKYAGFLYLILGSN